MNLFSGGNYPPKIFALTIQLFEQRQRDIKKAQSQAVLMLSKTLECSMEDLIND